MRSGILNEAFRALAYTSTRELTFRFIFPDVENEWLTFAVLAEAVPQLLIELNILESQWDEISDPAAAFFSVNPPGTWMRIRKLIGPDSMDSKDLHQELDSIEALGVVLQESMPILEQQQDQWYQLIRVP